MYTYSEQREQLDKVRVKEGETKRINCPFCGGDKTFTLSNVDGRRIWNCYKASCKASGSKSVGRTTGSIRRKLTSPVIDLRAGVRSNPSPLPEIISFDTFSRPEVLTYLNEVHAFDAVCRGMIKVGYAPKENRVLFFMNGDKGAVGRALDDRKPKWKAFGDTTGIFSCGSGRTAIVVEDAASACAVSTCEDDSFPYTGVALLGTNLNALQKRQLTQYDRVIFCLDSDASKRSIVMLRKIEGLVPASVKFLDTDLKWMSKEKIKETLR